MLDLISHRFIMHIAAQMASAKNAIPITKGKCRRQACALFKETNDHIVETREKGEDCGHCDHPPARHPNAFAQIDAL
jgi:hypothetical protein